MVKINILSNKTFPFDIYRLTKKILKEVLDYEKLDIDVSVNVLITGRYRIRRINKEQRNIDKVTDVLSFPNIKFDKSSNFNKFIKKGNIDISILDLNDNTIFLGDIVICYDKIISQSKKYNHSIKREYSFLLTHSIFHLLGYDHDIEKNEKIMFKKQEDVLNRLKIIR